MEDSENLLTAMNDFQEYFNSVVTECQRFCYVTRAEEFQIQACETLEELLMKTKVLKGKVIANEYEDLANALLSFEMLAKALINELNMWIALKKDKPGVAWDYLVEAQMVTISAMQAHSVAGFLSDYANHLYALEEHLFPNHLFFSIGAIVIKAVCSICGQDYGECEHLVGRPYMGKLCHQEVQEYDLEEVSIVDKPANKHCRITNFTKNGITRDTFTWKIIKKDENEEKLGPFSELENGLGKVFI